MHSPIKRETLQVSDPKEKILHQQLNEFAQWMQRPKDAGEVKKDRLRPVPVSMLAIVF
jgi:hypothetical protein